MKEKSRETKKERTKDRTNETKKNEFPCCRLKMKLTNKHGHSKCLIHVRVRKNERKKEKTEETEKQTDGDTERQGETQAQNAEPPPQTPPELLSASGSHTSLTASAVLISPQSHFPLT